VSGDAGTRAARRGRADLLARRQGHVRALAAGTPILTATDKITVTGCPGVLGVFCSLVQWANVSARVTASGQPVLVQAPPPPPLAGPVPGDGAVAGPPPEVPLVAAMQLQVVAT
jgi:hypothetical protein